MAYGRIGVIGAMDSELAALIAALTQPAQETVQGLVFRTGRLGAREVVLVPMDATLIQQVLLNLMENAVLHGESTTELRLSVEHIGDEACFTVSDNGLGIPRERLATLFDGSLSGEKSGGFDMKKNMGIGLSVCQTIVKAHGGRITAENRPEGGAQFRFYLPLKEEKEDEDQG